jgi:hypothetical protein
MERIGLKQAIGALRSETKRIASRIGRGGTPVQVPDVSVEFQVELEKQWGSGGIRFSVVKLGGEASRALAVTCSLSLTNAGDSRRATGAERGRTVPE